MKTEAKALLDALTAEYISLSEKEAKEPMPFNKYIGNDSGKVYVRQMVVTNFFCLANLDFSPSVQKEGVLTGFIDFIKSNPYDYAGIMVENSQNPVLTKFLYDQGFELKSVDPMCDELSPTLILPFGTEKSV